MGEVPLHRAGGTAYRWFGRDGAETTGRPVVVLVHGVGLNQDLWRPWIPVLEPEYSVLTLDLLGHGDSGNPPGERSVRDFVDQVLGLCDTLSIRRFALVGFSLGAVIAQALASQHSDLLSHVVFLHSVYRRTEAQCEGVRERYRITRDQGPMATVELAIERWYSPGYRDRNPEAMERVRDIFRKHTHDGYLKAYYLFSHAEPEMRDYPLDRVRCPALVITGSAERGSTPEMSRAMARDLPDAELIINPGHLHMAPEEHADLVSSQVLEFLKKHPG